MNRQRSGFGLYAAFMVIIVLAMFYITGKISAGSSPSQQKFETAVKDGKVTSAQIVQNKEVPTGSVVVQEQGGDSYTVNVTDVNAAISLLEDADVTYTVQNVQRDSIFMTSVLPALLLGMILLFGMSMMNRSMGGGHDEREQTLNQLLVEMDGFGVNEGIIVMAATNRVDILDPAILRPGRFDRRVVVGPPDVMGREEILKVHAKNKPLAEDVDLKQIAQTTAGFTGAELENLLNEAAIMAAKDRRRFVRQSDIKSAFIKVGIGAEKRSKVISDKEKRITAYHETGHAILFHMLPDMEAVYTISIIPTGPGAAGYTMPQPENDDMFQTRGKMMQYITVCLGGRVAEELIFDDITTGASQDIKQATATARSMITKYGMSENLGLVAYDSDSDEVFIGRDWGHTQSVRSR